MGGRESWKVVSGKEGGSWRGGEGEGGRKDWRERGLEGGLEEW